MMSPAGKIYNRNQLWSMGMSQHCASPASPGGLLACLLHSALGVRKEERMTPLRKHPANIGQPPFDLCIIQLCVSVYLSIYLSVCLSVCRSVGRSVCLSVCLSVCRLSVSLSIYLSIYLPIYLSIYLSIYVSIFLSFYLSIYLSIYQYI